MRRVNQAASLIFLAVSIYVMIEAQNLEYWVQLGPGPGFFPFWLGLFMAALSIVWLGQVSFQPATPMEEGFIPPRIGGFRVVAMLIALVLWIGLVNVLGFRLTMLAFLLFIFSVLDRQNPVLTIAVSLMASFGVYYLFHNWLAVHLPISSIDLLQNLGL